MILFSISLFLGLLAGVLSGLFGLAGGTVIVPGLMVLGSFSQLLANGTSLASNLLPVGIFGVMAYWKKGHISFPVVFSLALGLLTGVWGGSFVALSLSPVGLKLSFGSFLLLLSLRFLLVKKTHHDSDFFPPCSRLVLFFTGLLAGVLSGLFGIGGGAIMVPILTEFFHFSQKKASASSLAALLLPVGLFGVIHYHQQALVHWSSAGLITLGLVIGIFFGAKLHLKSPEHIIRRSYAAYLFLIGLGFLLAGLGAF